MGFRVIEIGMVTSQLTVVKIVSHQVHKIKILLCFIHFGMVDEIGKATNGYG
ncbi:hypothetical protein D3C85_1567620 [compost metagenome]